VGELASPLHGAPQVFATGRSPPGLGAATVQAIGYNDLPMIQGVVLFAAFVVIIADLLIEIAYAALDPRVGTAEGVTASYSMCSASAVRIAPGHLMKANCRSAWLSHMERSWTFTAHPSAYVVGPQ